MDVIDDEGNLFGVINIIDALAVLLILAVVVAGAALVFQSEPESSGPTLGTTNVTLDLGAQPTYIVSAINEGDTYDAGGNSELTLTDVYLTPQGDQTRVIVRAELRGPTTTNGMTYADAPPRLGRTLTIKTNRYQVKGQIRAVGGGNTLRRDTTTVVLRGTMTAADARDIAPGDRIRVGGRTVATITDVAAYATGNPTQRAVFVETELQTYRRQDNSWFGGNPVRRGQTVTLAGDGYTLTGRIDRIDGGLSRATTDVVIADTVDAETARRLSEGDIATVAGHETARIATVTTYATQNPERKRIIAGLRLRTLAYGDRHRFGPTVIQRGNNVTVDTASYTLSGAIDRVGALTPRGSPATRTVTLRMSEVRQDMADAIKPGMAERSNGVTIARITDVTTEPSLIITTGQNGSVTVADHPFNRDVTITAELRVRETTTGIRFKGQSLRQGSTVVIDLRTVIVRATVISVGQ